ncbi:hypothetical protein SAMN05216228_101225 [Rhizobium tibeticum]|uniref:Uncharacterized protein n=1 Tax=Rhizobium tibeticum TaxID=501024 RepID=A0A1H8M5F8_9HYPH|nr:hypothetical protein RTCCBAU85039_3218 [Rhizobium tibeticum]SEO12612.1 hypothetical protein SAMN05216228_101225 [Rhizobium tibeticum]
MTDSRDWSSFAQNATLLSSENVARASEGLPLRGAATAGRTLPSASTTGTLPIEP